METNYQEAFINIVRILFPYIKIECVEVRTFYKIGSRLVYYSCVGIDTATDNIVRVETKENATHGTQVCVAVTDYDGNVLSQYSIWSHAFNWKGLGVIKEAILITK